MNIIDQIQDALKQAKVARDIDIREKLIEPKLFDLTQEQDQRDFLALVESGAVNIVDGFVEQEKELATLKKLEGDKGAVLSAAQDMQDTQQGVWVYYPWRNTIVHVLEKDSYERVRTSRNHNLITPAEQKQLRESRIGFAGLNVGNPAAICMALEGVGHEMKLADFDPLSLTNMNRFRTSIVNLDVNKATITARQIYEINPFARVSLFSDGIKQGKEEEFLLGPKLDILVEETDNLNLKISLREKAREHGIPVVMVTGNGPNVILDVERFDIDPELPLMNGYLHPEIIEKIKSGLGDIPPKEKVLFARDFIGEEFLTERLRESFLLVGSKLAGIPQLAEASFLRGTIVCCVARRIMTGDTMQSGRYQVSFEALFGDK